MPPKRKDGQPLPEAQRVTRREGLDVGQYTSEEWEFVRAVDHYKRTRRRPFPTWTEILAIAKALGYRKVET